MEVATEIYFKLGLACKQIGANEEAVECLEKAKFTVTNLSI
jgi:hypothetical protein